MTDIERPATPDRLFLWVMHRFSELFDQHAVLKGGMALRLLDSQRATTDIDYVFAPYESKREAKELVEGALGELEDADWEIDLHSKMLRARIRIDDAEIQIEANVARECPRVAFATGDFARSLGKPSQVIAMMAPDHALADKLAAWNERRLLRDLYDCYFLSRRVGARIDEQRLGDRLQRIESRRPELRKRKTMSRDELAKELEQALQDVDEKAVEAELGPLLPPEEIPGLAMRIRASLSRLVEVLRTEGV